MSAKVQKMRRRRMRMAIDGICQSQIGQTIERRLKIMKAVIITLSAFVLGELIVIGVLLWA